METSLIVAFVSVVGSVLVASTTFYLTKRHQIRMEWQKEKITHYKVLVTAISDLAIDDTDKVDANVRFCSAVNSICLVAPEHVITALMAFHNEVKHSNPNKSLEKHDELLRNLMLAIRKDVGVSGKDPNGLSDFHLIGKKPNRKGGGA